MHQLDLSAFNDEKGVKISGDWRHYSNFAAEESGFNVVDDDEESICESQRLLNNTNTTKGSSSCGNDNAKCQAPVATAPVPSVTSKGERLKAKHKVIIVKKYIPTAFMIVCVGKCHLTNTRGGWVKIVIKHNNMIIFYLSGKAKS